MSRKDKKISDMLGSMKRNGIILTWFVVVALVFVLLAKSFVLDKMDIEEMLAAQLEQRQIEEVTIPSDVVNQRIDYKGFTVFFNRKTHMPNCVVYELTGKETRGRSPRINNFEEDTSVAGCARPWDYTQSGYDRGHMAPAGDLKWDSTAMAESFRMTNVCPQRRSLNEGGWNRLEEKTREWARRDSALTIVAGPIIGNNSRYIGEKGHRIPVPERFFKIILSLYNGAPRAIAFIYDNKSCNRSLRDYATSVDEIEAITGFDFFSALPDEIEDEIESQNNINAWLHP